MSKLSLDAIRIVQAIKLTGSFSTAATMLHKTPSAISYRVSSTESRLGVKLFHRNGPIITLTDEGNMLLKEGEWIINAVDCLEQRITTPRRGMNDYIRIAINNIFPIEILHRTMRDYLVVKRKFRLEINRFDEGSEWDVLENNLADLIITSEQQPVNIEANTSVLCNSPVVCCCGVEHRFPHIAGLIDEEALAGDTLLIQKDDLRRISTRSVNGNPHQKTITLPDQASVISLLKNGYGHAYLPYLSVASEIAAGTLQVLKTEQSPTNETFWLAWHPRTDSKCMSWWRTRLLDMGLSDDMSQLSGEVLSVVA